MPTTDSLRSTTRTTDTERRGTVGATAHERRVDVAIVDGGLSGLTVANRIAAAGADVLVLEQGSEASYACNTRYSGGLLHVAFKDMAAPSADIAAAIGDSEEPAVRHRALLANDARAILDWLQSEGGTFKENGPFEFMRWFMAPPRPRGAGLDWRGYGPDQLLTRLERNLLARGGELLRSARASRLIINSSGAVEGVHANVDGRAMTVKSNAVVIADGGFQANHELLRQYVTPVPSALLQRGAATGYGDGLLMALEAGAAVDDGSAFYGHLLGREALDNDDLWPYPVVDPIANVAIVVGPNGCRFADEGQGGVYLANAVSRLPDPLSTTLVFDDAIWNGVAADDRYPPCMNPVFEAAGGQVFHSDTIAELAAQTGIDAAGLQATVTAHNALAHDGTPVTPARTTRRFQPAPIATPPFHAIHLCAGITYTMGGIATDSDARVQREEGGTIPGLYAVGSASGGIEGGPAALYLGGLAKAVATGLRAASHLEHLLSAH